MAISNRDYKPTGAWVSWEVYDQFSNPVSESGSPAVLGDGDNATGSQFPILGEGTAEGLMAASFIGLTQDEKYARISSRIATASGWTIEVKASADSPYVAAASLFVEVRTNTNSLVQLCECAVDVVASGLQTFTATGSCASWPTDAAPKTFSIQLAPGSNLSNLGIYEITISIPVVVVIGIDSATFQTGIMQIE